MSSTTKNMFRKAKTKRGQRILKAQEPQVHEEMRSALFLQASTSNSALATILKDIAAIKKPNSKFLSRKVDKMPFEDDGSIRFLTEKNQCAAFAITSHSKKRPLNIVFGRTFDHQVLDMVEFGIDNVLFTSDFKTKTHSIGSLPALIFQGDAFETDDTMRMVRSLFTDFFFSQALDNINADGLEHAIVISCAGQGRLTFRHYRTDLLAREDSSSPKAQITEIGPHFDLTVRRTQFGADDVRKQAMRVPKEVYEKKVKNVEYNALGDKMGRVHMKSQNLGDMALRKYKGLKKPRDDASVSHLIDG